ncbi:MAG: GNAT family N-acetyltransferase [Marivirga sp.]|nr:GNAT family N-acetyltransferase [Marivirga sp.]
MIQIVNATLDDVITIQQMAEQTWWSAYSEIISQQQIRYMLDTIYGEEPLKKVMSDGSQEFILVRNDTGHQGFASFGRRKEDPDIFKLHKLYVLPGNQGKGYGIALIEEIKKRLIGQNIRTLDLNVNRYNKAKAFYEKVGFRIIREEDIAIGPYWMNDYVMRLDF